MKSRFYLLIGCSLVWFLFGTIILIRSNKDFGDLKAYEGQVERIRTTVTKNPIRGDSKDILYFNVKGLNTTLGIYHNTKADYDYYLNRIEYGDSIRVYFDEYGIETGEDINLHVFQLEKDGEVLLDKENLSRTNKKVGFILYGVGLIFSIAPIWFYRTKMK